MAIVGQADFAHGKRLDEGEIVIVSAETRIGATPAGVTETRPVSILLCRQARECELWRCEFAAGDCVPANVRWRVGAQSDRGRIIVSVV